LAARAEKLTAPVVEANELPPFVSAAGVAAKVVVGVVELAVAAVAGVLTRNNDGFASAAAGVVLSAAFVSTLAPVTGALAAVVAGVLNWNNGGFALLAGVAVAALTSGVGAIGVVAAGVTAAAAGAAAVLN